MSHFNDDGRFTVKVMKKSYSFLHDVTDPISKEEWENSSKNNDVITAREEQFSYDFRVCDLKERYSSSKYKRMSFYVAEGFGKPFHKLHPEYTGNFLCEVHSGGILLIVVNNYERKWDDDDDCDEPYPGWQSLIDTTNI